MVGWPRLQSPACALRWQVAILASINPTLKIRNPGTRFAALLGDYDDR